MQFDVQMLAQCYKKIHAEINFYYFYCTVQLLNHTSKFYYWLRFLEYLVWYFLVIETTRYINQINLFIYVKSVVHKIAIKMNTTEVIDSAINILAQNIVISNLIITVLGFPAHKSVCWIVDTPMTNFWNFWYRRDFFKFKLKCICRS